jgi:hypothetical protein
LTGLTKLSAARAKGNLFENCLLPLLKQHYPVVQRIGLPGTRAGSNGLGDYKLFPEERFVLEAKNHARLDLGSWHKQVSADALTAAKTWGRERVAAVIVHKRHGTTKPEEQWVTMSMGDFLFLVNDAASGDMPGTAALRGTARTRV